MDCMEAIIGRRSCRNFTEQKVEEEKLLKVLQAGIYAPSPANKQPWEFIVVQNPEYNKRLKAVVDQTKEKISTRSDWTWIPKLNFDFINQAPVLIVVSGDPSRNGAEQFLDEPTQGYEHACCAAIQNMLLAAHSQGLGTLWLSLFEKTDARKIFDITEDKDPLAIICLGYPTYESKTPRRKDLETKVRYIR